MDNLEGLMINKISELNKHELDIDERAKLDDYELGCYLTRKEMLETYIKELRGLWEKGCYETYF